MKKLLSFLLCFILLIGSVSSGIVVFAEDVIVPVSNIILNTDGSDTIYMPLRSQYSLNPQVEPANATNQNLEYVFEGHSVSFDQGTTTTNGILYSQGVPGTTKITVRATDGSNVEKTVTVISVKNCNDIDVLLGSENYQLVFDASEGNDVVCFGDKEGNVITFEENPLKQERKYRIVVPNPDYGDSAMTFEAFSDLPDNYEEKIEENHLETAFVSLENGFYAALGYRNHKLVLLPFEYNYFSPNGKYEICFQEFVGNDNVRVSLTNGATVFDSENDYGIVLTDNLAENPIENDADYCVVFNVVYEPDNVSDWILFHGKGSDAPIEANDHVSGTVGQPHIHIRAPENGAGEEYDVVFIDGKLVLLVECASMYIMTPSGFSLVEKQIMENLHVNQYDYAEVNFVPSNTNSVFFDMSDISVNGIASYKDGEIKGLSEGFGVLSLECKNVDGSSILKNVPIVVDAANLTVHPAVAAVDGQDGNVEYFTNSKDEKYIADENGQYVSATDDDIVAHLPGEPVQTHAVYDEDFGDAQFTLSSCCKNCNKLISEKTVQLRDGIVYGNIPTFEHGGELDYFIDEDGNYYVFSNFTGRFYQVEYETLTMSKVKELNGEGSIIDVRGERFSYEEDLDIVLRDNNGEQHRFIAKSDEANAATCSTQGSLTLYPYCAECGQKVDGVSGAWICYLPHTDEDKDNVCDLCGYSYLSQTYQSDQWSGHSEAEWDWIMTCDYSYFAFGRLVENMHQYLLETDNAILNAKETAPTMTNVAVGENGSGSFVLSHVCGNCGKEVEAVTTVTKVEPVLPTVNAGGNIEYWVDNDDNVYVYDSESNLFIATNMESVTLPALQAERHEAVNAEDGKDGVKEYFDDGHGNKYVFEDDIYVLVTDDQLVEHMIVVRQENVVPATCTKDGSYDLISYCKNCGKTFDNLTETVSVSMTAHVDENSDGTCDSCGTTMHESNKTPQENSYVSLMRRLFEFLIGIIKAIQNALLQLKK